MRTMTKKEKRDFNELLYKFGTQSLVLISLLRVLSRNAPDLKDKLAADLEKMRHPHLTGQAMIDEAIDFVKQAGLG